MKLLKYKTDNKLTYEQLAEKLGLGPGRAKDAHRYCTGEYMPKKTMMQHIFKLTNGQVDANDFYDIKVK